MKVCIMYFAAMRDQAGKGQETIETNSITVDDLFNELKQKYNFTLDTDNLKVAINEEYTDFSQKLCEMDTVVFIPPVAGG